MYNSDNKTTFPSNWKELIRPGPPIFHLYLQYLYDGQLKYGPKTIVFMQVGMFHEMYGVENQTMNVGLVSQMAHDLNIQMTRRKKSVIDNSPKNYLMVGFPSVHIDRYTNILIEDDWTVIIVDQIDDPKLLTSAKIASTIEEEEEEEESDEPTDIMDPKSEKNTKTNKKKIGTNKKKTVTRAITRVASPSTFVEKTMKEDNNFLVSLYLREDNYTHQKPGQKLNLVAGSRGSLLLSAGCSAIDLTTGENYVYEVYSNIEDQGLAIDEAFRFLCTFQPREIIVNSENLSQYDEESLISKLDLHTTPHQIKINSIPTDYKKISYQNTLLKKCFPDHGSLTPLEFLDLESKSLAALSYVLILQYAYEHNEKLINALPRPRVLDTYNGVNKTPSHLILTNNTIHQLNLIPEAGSHANSNNHTSAKIYRSVFTVINKTSTAMGSRLLRHKFLNPVTDPDLLEEHYNQIEELRGKGPETNLEIWKEVENHLLRIKDIERINRKINLKTIQPLEWIELDQDLLKINQLCEMIRQAKVLKKFMNEHEDLLHQLIDFQGEYRQIIDLQMAAKYTLASVEDNFFKLNYDPELDALGYKIKHYEQFFKTLTRSLSNMITPGSDYVALKRGESGYYLTITKTRFIQLKMKFQDSISFRIDETNYTVKADDLVETPVSKKSSNLNVQHKILTKMSLELGVLHEELRSRVLERYYNFLEGITRRFGNLLAKLGLIVAKIDVLKSIAKVADQYNYCKPEILREKEDKETNSFIEANNLRHPIIERINESIKYVPHSLCLGNPPLRNLSASLNEQGSKSKSELEPESDLGLESGSKLELGPGFTNCQDGMIVFGINSAGKSSLMKSVGVNLILAQAGFYVAASSFRYYPYDQILTRIVGDDNLFKGQSSFEVEMIELRGILSRARNNHSLVLGDEVCKGTETTSGVSIVAASIITLAERGSSFIFASHLHQLAEMPRIKALTNVRSYHLKIHYQERDDLLIYDRNLCEGSGDAIYGLEVVKAMHMDTNFIKLAQDIRREIMGISPVIIPVKQSKYNTDLYMTTCQICQGPAEDTHHIMEQCKASEKGFIDHYHKNVLANLVVLCKKCHLAVHGQLDHSSKSDKRLSKSDSPGSKRILKINGYLQTNNGPVLDFVWTDGETNQDHKVDEEQGLEVTKESMEIKENIDKSEAKNVNVLKTLPRILIKS